MSALNFITPAPQPAQSTPVASAQNPSSPAAATPENNPDQKSFAQTLDTKLKTSDSGKPSADADKANVDGKPADTAETPQGADAAAAAATAAMLAALLGNPNPQAAPVADASTGTDLLAQGDAASAAAAALVAGNTLPGEANAAASDVPAATALPVAPLVAGVGNAAANTRQDMANTDSRKDRTGDTAATLLATRATDSKAVLSASEALPLASAAAPSAADPTPEANLAALNPQASAFADQLAARNAQLARNEAPQFPVHTQVAQKGWSDEIGDRVVWMANKDIGRAELVLTPAHLGRVEISLSMKGDQASASFVAATPAAREALEQSMPRLREVLAQAGVTLDQVNVSANGAGSQPQPERRSTQGGGRGNGGGFFAEPAASAAPPRQRNVGLVDTFA